FGGVPPCGAIPPIGTPPVGGALAKRRLEPEPASAAETGGAAIAKTVAQADRSARRTVRRGAELIGNRPRYRRPVGGIEPWERVVMGAMRDRARTAYGTPATECCALESRKTPKQWGFRLK